MNYKNYDINAPEFDSKIKYYFSLFFISIKSYEVLRDTYGEDLNLFKNEPEINSVNNYENISLIFENLKWNNNQINLSDKTILNFMLIQLTKRLMLLKIFMKNSFMMMR